MKKFVAISLIIIMLCLFSVFAFAIIVPVDESNHLYQFDVGDGNLVFPLDSDFIYKKSEEDQESVNSFLNLLNDPNYIVVFSFNSNNITQSGNCSIGIIPKDTFYVSEQNYNGAIRYLASSKGNSFYRASFSYNKTSKLFQLSTPYIASGGGIPLSSGYYQCWSPSFSFASHDVIKFLDLNSISFTGYYPPITGYTLTVNYLYAEGVSAADSVTQTVAAGEEYSIPSPEIAGYTPSVPLVAGTMPEEDLTVDVYYIKAFYPLTVRYRYQDGTQAAADVVQQYPAGFFYDIPSPQIAGYQPDKATVTGTMPGQALEEVVIYTGKPYTLTVDYLYEDGSWAAPSHTEQLITGTAYSVPSPELSDYTPSMATVTGVMPGADKRITVIYRRASGGSSDAGSSGTGSGGSSGDGGDSSDPGGSSGGGIPPFSGSDPFEVGGLPSYTQDPFSMALEQPKSEYLAFSPEYLYHTFSMLRENTGIVFSIGLYAFLAVLTIYVALHVIDIFQ